MKRKVHYAWIIAVFAMLISGAGSGIFISTLGVFVKPVCELYGFQRASFTLYSTIFFIVNVTMMPIYGNLFRNFGFKKVSLVSALMCALSLLIYSFSNKLWMFYAAALLSGLFINGISIMAVGILVNTWFEDSRGLASGLAFSGSGIIAAILLPTCNTLIESHGTAFTYRALMIIELLITVPVILFVLKDKPEDMGLAAYKKAGSVPGAGDVPADLKGITRSEAFKRISFWMLFFSTVGIAVCQAGPNSNTVSILNDIGYTSAYSARISSIYMVLLTVCKIIMGGVFDRLGSLRGSMLIGAALVLFPIAAQFNHISWMPYLYVLLLALASSGSTVLGSYLTGSYFGKKDYARIFSIISLGIQLGAAFSTPIFGRVYDTTGGYFYAWIFVTVLAVIVVGALITAYIRRPVRT